MLEDLGINLCLYRICVDSVFLGLYREHAWSSSLILLLFMGMKRFKYYQGCNLPLISLHVQMDGSDVK